MSSSIGLKSGIGQHGRALVSIILVQIVLILWLASWAVGDYLNNQYVRAYVDGTVQADSFVIGGLFFIVLLGSVLGLVLRRRRHASLSLEVPKTRMRGSMSVPTKSPMSGQMKASSAGPVVKSVSLTGQTVEGPKPAVELHPAVAALKADLSEQRMSLGLASVGPGPANASQPTGYASQKPGMNPQQTPSPQMSIPQRPQSPFSSQSPPSTVIRPGPPAQAFRPNPPPTVIRPTAPLSPPPLASVPGSSAQPLPVLRVESGNAPAAPRPMGLLPQPQALPPTVKDVSTVITGIVPPLKKKDSDSLDSQNSSGQSSS